MPRSLEAEDQHRARYFVIAAGVLVVLAMAAAMVIRAKAPFSRASITEQIQTGTRLRFEAGTFRTSWFPPGFTAENVRLIDPQGGSATTLLTAKTMIVKGSYLGLLQTPRSIPEMYLNGAVLTIPPNGWDLFKRFDQSNSTAFSEIRIEDSALDVKPEGQNSVPLRFAIRQLSFRHLGEGGPVGFEVAMTNPQPRGEVYSRGHFGPWNSRDPFGTRVSGSFTFDKVDLTIDHAVTATLNSSGKFSGVLRSIDCNGSADLPAFEVFSTGHPVRLAADFEAVVNARNGDTMLKRVTAHFNNTTISAEGQVSGTPDRNGKTTALQMSVRGGRVEDLLNMFTAGQPSMHGGISFDSSLELPPGPPDFLTRLAIKGDFGIDGARFTNPQAQQPIDRLSGSAEGEKKPQVDEDPPHVVAHVRGHVADAQGVATLSNVLFKVPGVDGTLHGTFALKSRRIDMAGEIATTGKLSDTTNGVKWIFLKVVSPVWKKRANVEIIPFHITGSSSKPSFNLELHR